MIHSRKPKWISTLCDTMIDKVDWNRLEGERHIGSSGVVNRSRLLSPECMDIFVQLCIDPRTRASIVMTLEISAAKPHWTSQVNV